MDRDLQREDLRMTRPAAQAGKATRAYPKSGYAAGWLLLLGASVTAAAVSCTVVGGHSSTGMTHTNTTSTETTTSMGTGGSGGSGGMGTGGSTTMEITGRSIFESTVQNDMVMECGSCHKLGGIADAPFLAAPDIYVSITTWPGVVVSNASLSVVLTHPGSSSHGGGQAPDISAGLRTKIEAWLHYEADHLPKPDAGSIPHIDPFKPFLQGAFNAVYLDPLGPEFANCSITFNAEELPSPNSPTLLHITNIQVHPIAGVELHLVHPLFTIYPSMSGEIPDIADSFSGFDQSFTLAGDPTFGTGQLILSHWQKDARLGIAFEKIEATKNGVTVATCKNVAKFQAEVVPQLKMWPCASMCHGGGNISAQQQMDLSNIDAMPPDEACAQVRARIDPMNPDNSQIFAVTDPTKPAIHLFKFAGNKNNHTSFKTAVTPWIISEQ